MCNANSEPNSYRDTYSEPDANIYSHSNTNGHSHSEPDSYRYTYSEPDAHIYSHSNSNGHRDAYCYD
jgi:hypothetical protein